MLFRLVGNPDISLRVPSPILEFSRTLRRNWNLLTRLGASGEKSLWTPQIIAVTSWQNAVVCCR